MHLGRSNVNIVIPNAPSTRKRYYGGSKCIWDRMHCVCRLLVSEMYTRVMTKVALWRMRSNGSQNHRWIPLWIPNALPMHHGRSNVTIVSPHEYWNRLGILTLLLQVQMNFGRETHLDCSNVAIVCPNASRTLKCYYSESKCTSDASRTLKRYNSKSKWILILSRNF